MPSRFRSRYSHLGLLLLASAAVILAGCASTNVVEVSPDVYQVTVKDRTKAFEMDPANYKHRAVNAAMEYAESKGKVAVPVGMTQNVVGLVGENVEVNYQFRMVDRDDPRAKTGGVAAAEKKPDYYDELMKLDDLRKKGILSEAEFAAEKKKLLDQHK